MTKGLKTGWLNFSKDFPTIKLFDFSGILVQHNQERSCVQGVRGVFSVNVVPLMKGGDPLSSCEIRGASGGISI